MNAKEQVDIFLNREKPDVIPYTVNIRMWRMNNPDDPIWNEFFKEGLGLSCHVPTAKEIHKGVTLKKETCNVNGRVLEKTTLSTPVGDIYRIADGSWTLKYWIENEKDYEVMLYIVKNTDIVPDYDNYRMLVDEIESRTATSPVIKLQMGRSPFQKLQVELLGLENFAFHLFDYEDLVDELYKALYKNFIKKLEIVAEGPGRFIWLGENFSAETIGRERYKTKLMNVYEECAPLAHQNGKIFGVHFDGRTNACKDLIANSAFDLIESLTPPPEGDMEYKDARIAWPDKLLWCNINVSKYFMPFNELSALVKQYARDASVDGRLLAFGISEDLPANWRDSIPVVLRALKEYALE
ncbi:MAG: hypothetical protein HPY74_03135 [Firmicutes bacterium]|nr:hypothetical protein [Bacillota bacterium]